MRQGNLIKLIIWLAEVLISSCGFQGDFVSVKENHGFFRRTFESIIYVNKTYSMTCVASDYQYGTCLPLLECLSRFSGSPLELLKIHDYTSCSVGFICCPASASTEEKSPPMPMIVQMGTRTRLMNTPVSLVTKIPKKTIIDAKKAAEEEIKRRMRLERELEDRNLLVKRGSPESFLLAVLGTNPQQTRKSTVVSVITCGELIKRIDKDIPIFGSMVRAIDETGKTFRAVVPFIIDNEIDSRDQKFPSYPCASLENYKYRTMDGSCNNLQNPTWGQALTVFERLLPNAYTDGVDTPRVSGVHGNPLPVPREISAAIAIDIDNPTRGLTNMFQLFGQFLDHDLTRTAVSRTINGSGISCCNSEIQANPERLRHPECFELNIPRNDLFYAQFNRTCLEFVRSAIAPRPLNVFGPREQLNQLTAYIDGSQVYGSSLNEAHKLRSFVRGRLRASFMEGAEFLSLEEKKNKSICTTPKHTGLSCFEAGDGRVNEHILLTVMQTVWQREHNRIVDDLAYWNPYWDDETLFQEARRIVAAAIQHITYNEFLPPLLGNVIMTNFRLWSIHSKGRFFYGYDPDVNAGAINAFATAAFRFGHSMVQGQIQLRGEAGENVGRLTLRQHFFNPELLHSKRNLADMVRGLAFQKSQSLDPFFTKELTNHLFDQREDKHGLDLVSLNIQRGRDHGLPPYNDWREACGLRRLTTFDEMAQVMRPHVAQLFSEHYRHVDDVDLYIAGVSEYPVEGGIVGPTFACIIAEQFRRLKYGDRFWYENGGMNSSFTKEQLNEIRKITLARVLCDNVDDIRSIQSTVFRPISRHNPRVECINSKLIPRMNLQAWESSYWKK